MKAARAWLVCSALGVVLGGCASPSPVAGDVTKIPRSRPLEGSGPLKPVVVEKVVVPPKSTLSPFAQQLQTLLRGSDDDIDEMQATVRDQINGYVGGDRETFVSALDSVHEAMDRTLTALDTLTPPPGTRLALEAVKDYYEGLGDQIELQKEAYLDNKSRATLRKAEAATRAWLNGPGNQALKRAILAAGLSWDGYEEERTFIRRNGKPL